MGSFGVERRIGERRGKGDKGMQKIKFVCEYCGSFTVPNQYATALREHWWSGLAESPLFAVITIAITHGFTLRIGL